MKLLSLYVFRVCSRVPFDLTRSHSSPPCLNDFAVYLRNIIAAVTHEFDLEAPLIDMKDLNSMQAVGR